MRTIRHLALTAASLAAVACAGDRSTAPESPSPAATAARAPRAVTMSGTLTCDPSFAQSTTDARAFFASASDPVFTTLRDMQHLYRNGGARAATDTGFDALEQIEAARLTSRQGGTADDGDALTKDLLACMRVGPIPSGFSVAAALGSGVYAVRGGSHDAANPALAWTSVAGQRTNPSPAWGIEPLVTWAGRFDRRQTRFLVYGAPLPVSSFANDPASTDPNDVAYTGFDISTIPAMPELALIHSDGSAAPVRVGICIDLTSEGKANLLVHGGSGGTNILQLSSPEFCSGFASASPARRGLLATFARGALALVTPAPAYALAIGGVGGLPSGLSPFGPVKVRPDSVVLTFTQQPSDGPAGAAISPPVQVKATTANGTPIGGVQITLHVISGNSTNAAVAMNSTAVTSDAPDASGIATFPKLSVTQPGSYTLLAVGSLAGHATSNVTSVMFTMR